MKTLDKFCAGESGVIQAISGGHKFLSRASAMGFTPNASVKVLKNGKHGPLIVNLRDTEVAIGRGEAAKIGIEEAGL